MLNHFSNPLVHYHGDARRTINNPLSSLRNNHFFYEARWRPPMDNVGLLSSSYSVSWQRLRDRESGGELSLARQSALGSSQLFCQR